MLLSCNKNESRSAQSDTGLKSKLDSAVLDSNDEIALSEEERLKELEGYYYNGEDEPTEEELIRNAYNYLIKSYNVIETIDSSLIVGTDTYNVRLEYSCLKNTTVIVPKHFLTAFMDEDFPTHDFIMKLIIRKNNETYFERTYEKKYFFEQLTNEILREIGVLLSPNISLIDEGLEISASLSIPLTDVGQRVGDTIKLQ